MQTKHTPALQPERDVFIPNDDQSAAWFLSKHTEQFCILALRCSGEESPSHLSCAKLMFQISFYAFQHLEGITKIGHHAAGHKLKPCSFVLL